MSRFSRRKKRRDGMTKAKAGVIGIVLIILFSYLAYTKFANPFASKFTVHALFSSANGLRPDSLVRIAGINVGRVASVSPVADCKTTSNAGQGCQAADVTMEIQDVGLPLHKDATFAIRPRIFLEGNFFVDVRPGTPSSPIAPDNHTFPIQSGVAPVQLDQVLTGLQADTQAQPAAAAQGVRHRGEEGRTGVQPLDPVLAARLQVHVDRRPRRAGDPAPRPVQLDRPDGDRVRRRSTHTRRTSRA